MVDVIHTRRYPGSQEEAGYAARTALDDVLAWFLADGYTTGGSAATEGLL